MSTYKLSRKENAALLALQKHDAWTPEGVFEAARPVGHPLHNRFEWDRNKGWMEHNLDIARGLIRSVVFERIVRKRGHATVQRIPIVRHPDRPRTYTPATSITQRSSKLKVILAEAKAAESHLRRAFAIAAMYNLGDVVERAIDATVAVYQAAEAATVPQLQAAE